MKVGIWFGTINDGKIKKVLEQEVLPDLILFTNDNDLSKQMTTQIQQIITRYETRSSTYVITVDNLQAVPASFEVTTLPTLLFIRKREIRARIAGACSRKLLESRVQKMLKPSDKLINH